MSEPAERSLSVLVVGGGSAAARAFRAWNAARGEFALTVLVRANDTPENVQVVEDYFAPPASALVGIDALVNFTGIAQGSAQDLRQVNVGGPCALARLARSAGVRHFVQISSLSVYGGAQAIGHATPECPVSAYGRSKLAGDRALPELQASDFRVTALRVPILYSAEKGDKLHRLARLMRRLGWFPVPAREAPRSILSMDNLAVIVAQILRERAAGVRFGADPEPFTLTRLAARLSTP